MQITLPISYISHGKEKFRENDKYAYFIHNVTTFGRKLHKSLKQNDLYLLFRKGDFHKLKAAYKPKINNGLLFFKSS